MGNYDKQLQYAVSALADITDNLIKQVDRIGGVMVAVKLPACMADGTIKTIS